MLDAKTDHKTSHLSKKWTPWRTTGSQKFSPLTSWQCSSPSKPPWTAAEERKPFTKKLTVRNAPSKAREGDEGRYAAQPTPWSKLSCSQNYSPLTSCRPLARSFMNRSRRPKNHVPTPQPKSLHRYCLPTGMRDRPGDTSPTQSMP